MTNFILGIIEITLTMSALIILALIFSKIFGARFSAKCRYIVWALIILRLCIPLNLPILPPLYTYELPSEDFKVEEDINIPTSPSIPDDTPITNTPVVNTPVTSTPPVITPPTTSVPTTPVTPEPPITAPEPIAPIPSLSVPDMLYVIGIVWATVAALYLTFRLTVHGIYVASLSKSKTLPSPALSAFYSDVCGKMGIKNAPRLYVSASVVSPMLVGFFSPCIILPDVKFNDIELEGILSHELTHYRRGDLWLKLFSLISTSLHWFNPLVHIAAARLAQETELSCDEAVLSGSNDEVRRIYGETVLSVIRRNCHKSIALTTHFNPKKSAVKERFKAILDSTKKRRGRIIIAVVLVLCAIAGAIIGCSFSDDEPTVYFDPIASEFKSAGKLPDDIDNAAFEVRPIGSDTTVCCFGDSLSYYLLGATNEATRYKLSPPDGYTKASIIFISPGAGSGEAVFTVSANRDGKTEYLSYLFSFGDSLNMPISISTLTKNERKAIDEQIAAYTPPARAERFEAGQSYVDFSAQFPEDIEKNYPYTTIGNYSFHMYESGRSFYVYDKVKGSTIKTTLSLPVDFSGAEILFMQSARNGEDLEIFVTAYHKTMRYVIIKYNISADSQYQYHTEISLVGQSEHDAIYNAKEKYSEEAREYRNKPDNSDVKDLTYATEHALKLAKYFGEPITSTDELKGHSSLWEFLSGSVYELHNKGMLTLNMPDNTHYYIPANYMQKAIELYLGIESGLPDRLLRPEYNWFTDIDTFVYTPFSPIIPVTECVEAKIEYGLYLITVRISNSEGEEIALNTYAFEKIHTAEFGDIFRLVGISESSDTISRVIAGTAQMYIDDSITLLSDWLSNNGFYITKYALTDLDGNGTNEGVLSLGIGTNDYYGHLVLHTYKGRARAELIEYRSFYEIKQDGTFTFSISVSNYGIGKLVFENGKLDIKIVAHRYNPNQYGELFEYLINDQKVTKAEFDAYIATQDAKPDVTWHEIEEAKPDEIVARSHRLSVDVTVSLNIPSSWYRNESMNSWIWLDEAKPFHFVSNDYSSFNDTIKRVIIYGDANDFDELKKQLEADTTYEYSFDSPIVGVTDSGYKYEGVYANMTGSRRYIFCISTGKDIYNLEIWEWTAYDSDGFLKDMVIPIVKSFTITYEDAVTITDIADWDNLPWIEEPKESRKRAPNAYNLINNLVSGKSDIPEYNELGIKDYSITLLENSSLGTVLSFTFTVKGNSLPETLPPGTYTKILSETIDVFVYDSYEEYKAHSSDKHGLSGFQDNIAVDAVHRYLCYMPYIWEISPHGEWDMSNRHLPYNYISAFYGNESLVIGFEELQKLMLEKFGITVERPAESCYLSRCKYDKETDTVDYADTRGYEPIHRFIDYKAIDGTAYVTVQLYADRNYLLPSHKVTYRIGADEVFLDFEITEQGKYEPNSLR